jgi:signal transduction histidine kinase
MRSNRFGAIRRRTHSLSGNNLSATSLRSNSLSVKILLAYIAGILVSIGLIALAAFVVTSAQADALSRLDMEVTVRDFAAELRFDEAGVPLGFKSDDFNLDWAFISMKQETAYRVLDAGGHVVFASAAGDAFWGNTSPDQAVNAGSYEFEHDGVAMRGATATIVKQGRTWHMQFAASTRFMQLLYRAFALPFTSAGIVIFSVILLLIFLPCAYLALRFSLKPLRQISQAAAAISPSSLGSRLPARGVPSEIAPLVESFNQVLVRLETGYRAQQDFLATAAHELKTPLALIRAQIELQTDTAERRLLLNDVEHMARQVQQLLHLAEASEVQNYKPTRVNVREIVSEATEYLQRMADAAAVQFVITPSTSDVTWSADRGAFFTLLKNLLENAVQHAPRNSAVRVDLTDDTLTVSDAGAGVNEADMARLFVRFWRGAHRRDHGAGLGLAICQAIAHAQGWQISASPANPGLRLTLARTSSDARP